MARFAVLLVVVAPLDLALTTSRPAWGRGRKNPGRMREAGGSKSLVLVVVVVFARTRSGGCCGFAAAGI